MKRVAIVLLVLFACRGYPAQPTGAPAVDGCQVVILRGTDGYHLVEYCPDEGSLTPFALEPSTARLP